MAKSPGKFVREVRSEVSKVHWPTTKETMMSTVMVLIMLFVAIAFILLADSAISTIIKFILG